MLTKEELQKNLSEGYSRLPESQIEKMTDNLIESLYGSQEQYEARLSEQGQDIEALTDEATNEAFEAVRDQIEEDDYQIKNYHAAAEYERLIKLGINDVTAFSRVKSQYGDSIYDEVKDSESKLYDREIDRIVKAGLTGADQYRDQIKALLKANGGINRSDDPKERYTAADAFKEVVRSEALKEERYDQLDDEEKEYHSALSVSEKHVLEGLRKAMPDNGWTAEKLYKNMHGNKPLPAKPKPEPEEERVPMELYLEEQEKTRKAKEKLAALGVFVDD